MRRIVWGLVELAGAVSIVHGVHGMFAPAGWVVAGVFALLAERARR